MGEHELLLNSNFYFEDRTGNINCTATTNNLYNCSISSSDPCATATNRIDFSGLCTTIKNEDTPEIKLIPENWHGTCELVFKDILNNEKEEESMDLHPVKIIFNDPVSVVFWEDGEKTVVRRHKGEPYDKYTAFCAALAIKIFGSNTEVNRIVSSGIDQQEKDLRKAEKIAMKQKAERMAKKAKKNG